MQQTSSNSFPNQQPPIAVAPDSANLVDPMYASLLVLHILGAAVWTGGHLVLAAVVLPRALRERSTADLQRFESGYEKIGIPALAIQVITGIWLAHIRMPDIGLWFDLSNPISRLIMIKLLLLILTAALALDARLRLIGNLKKENLTALAFHIVPVTVISVLFVVVGVLFRTGGL